MSEREACRQPRETTDRTGPVWERLEAERQHLFRGLGVLDTCRRACESLPADVGPEPLVDALQVAYDIIDWVTGEIEMIAGDAEDQARAIVRAAEGSDVPNDQS